VVTLAVNPSVQYNSLSNVSLAQVSAGDGSSHSFHGRQYSRCKLIVKGGGEARSPPSAYTSLRSEGAGGRGTPWLPLPAGTLGWLYCGVDKLVLRSPPSAYTSLRSEGAGGRHPLASPPRWYVRLAILRGGGGHSCETVVYF